MTPAAPRVLSADELNRSTLARQLLLARSRLDPVAAVARLVALQAQEPASPFLALWTRLEAFEASALDNALRDRLVVKATLLRMTLHAVAAVDYPTFWAALEPSFVQSRSSTLRLAERGHSAEAVRKIVELALAHAAEPRGNQQMITHLTELAGPLDDRDWWWAVRGMAPLLHVPADPAAGSTPTPWTFGPRPRYVAARAWLGTAPTTDPEEALDTFVLRYLSGFGPATMGDVAQFTKLGRARVRASFERLRAVTRTFRDEAGRELFDVVDGEIPKAHAEAPVRFLPMWDSVLLAYEDRSRLIPEQFRKTVIRTNGDVLPTFLVDGRVAGVWRADAEGDGTAVVWTAFARLPRATVAAVDAEAARLAAFVGPLDATVYNRYRRWWDKLEIPS